MAILTYDTNPARIGKLAGEIIGHAMATEVLGSAVRSIDMPKNKSDTMVVRSWVPYGGTVAAPNTWTVTAESHITQEGVTPPADSIVPRDVVINLQQYAALYSMTDKDFDLYEDDIPAAMIEQVGERMGVVREQFIYGQLKASTNKFYSGGTTRATVAGTITEKVTANVIRTLQRNHGMKITKILSPSQAYGTSSVEAAYVVYAHTDLEYDIRRLAGFVEVASYGTRSTISDAELGTWQNVRFILSAELNPIIDSGAAIGATGLKSTTGTLIDVYPMIFLAKDAFALLKLRGMDSLSPIYLPPGKADKNDPLGQRGYIGAKFYMGGSILNQGWMAVAEVGITTL